MERKITEQKLIVMSKNNSPNVKLTDEMIINSLDTFVWKPIIEVHKSLKIAIGKINKVEYKNGLVIADVVMFTDKYKDRFRYDNWMINFERWEEGILDKFEYVGCELYTNKII